MPVINEETLINNGETGASVRGKLNARFSEIAVEINRNRFYSKKLVTIGDSITEGNRWQPRLAEILGLAYDSAETISGKDGHKPMGVGGTTIIPYNNLGALGDNSIYIRADDVQFYSPDIIILFGGANDFPANPPYDLSDEEYTGPSLPTGDPGLPSFVSAYKGTLKKLIEQNPLAEIYCCSFFINGLTPKTHESILSYVGFADLIRDLARMYGCRFLDVMQVGFHPLRNSTLLADTVHPNDEVGGPMLGEYIASQL